MYFISDNVYINNIWLLFMIFMYFCIFFFKEKEHTQH